MHFSYQRLSVLRYQRTTFHLAVQTSPLWPECFRFHRSQMFVHTVNLSKIGTHVGAGCGEYGG